MKKYLQIDKNDNVAVALHDMSKGESFEYNGTSLTLCEDIVRGHKFALKDIFEGDNVVKYGFAIGHADLIADLNRVKYSFNPYNVNRLSLLAGAAAVEDEAYFQKCCAAIAGNREWTVNELKNMGFEVLPSQTNFVFAKSDRIGGGELYRLLKENGILVRWFDTDRIRDYVRITVGSLEQMVTLVEELARLLDEV